MRPLEATILVLLAIWVSWSLFTPRRPPWAGVIPIVAFLVMLVHLGLEKYRWQMLPLYVCSTAALLLGLRNLLHPNPKPPDRRASGVFVALVGLFVLGLSSLLPILLPVPHLPQPTGPYAIGTFSMELVDSKRTDPYAPAPASPRRLMMQIWYPAVPAASADLAPWIENMDVVAPALANFFDLPDSFFTHIRYARTHSALLAPLSRHAERYPLLLFSHGWSGFRAQNTYQMEELASRGYIVVAVDHTYGAMVTVFPDGSVAENNPAALPFNLPEEEYRAAANLLVTQWAEDLEFVLDTMQALDAHDPAERFTGRLDLTRIGALGHSTGGGAVVEFCARDLRCRAGLAMDAYLVPVTSSVIESGLSQPFMFLSSATWSAPGNLSQFDQLSENLSQPAYHLTIAGTGHYDFTDLPMFSPLSSVLGLKGPLSGSRVLRIINDYALAFFDQSLLGKDSSLLISPGANYPEVTFDAKNTGGQ
ncbi:MAG: hypothetical protein JW726_08520 [Anaerolineales bacterium]|nr:hypothetical protein [Anaerolineales bacterium]